MWLDNASNIDMLFYSPYADTIVNFAKNSCLTPLTIGLYGSWGAGKSSLLQLIKQRIESDAEDVVCISLNAWQFEGYEDAKIAIMESLLNALNDNKTFAQTCGEKIKGLLSRIDYLKIGKKLLKEGAPYLIGALTGNPLPIALNLSTDLANPQNILGSIKNFKDEYIKDAEEKEPQTENIRKFREDFENMLKEATSVKNLVVIVDDLDRCSPDRIIDTLEAIKLFLSVKKTNFIVAVDQRIIEYAVNVKYPQINGFEVSTDYIEKIIQLPIKIPELSPKDVENYLLLLVSQLHLTEDGFNALISEIYEKKMMLTDKALATCDIESIIVDKGCAYSSGSDKNTFEVDAEIISKIGPAVSSSLKGNPRQAKRFLNTFFVRKNLAALYFGKEINFAIMAKLLALETIEIKAFRKLYEWNSSFDGEIKELKAIEKAAIAEEDLGEEYLIWSNPRVLKWLQSEPTELYKLDLSKYFYLSRESLSSVESISASFNEEERKMLSSIQQCIMGQENTRIEELKAMPSPSQRKICDALIEHFKADSIGLNIIRLIYTEFADCRSDIVEILKQKPKGFYSMATLTHLQVMYNTSRKPMESLIAHIESNKYCDPTIMENFKKGSFIATAVERRKEMGTSKGYIAPSTPAWSQAKRSVSRFLSNPTSHERGNTASKYAQAMTSGRYSTEHVASIFSGVINFSSTSSSHGYATALRNIHREDILSLTPAEALSELVSHFANDGSTIDDKIALDCISESFEVLDISNPDDLQNIDANRLLKEMVCQFAKLKFAQMFDKQIRFKCPIIEEANARIAEMQEFIYYTMEQQLTPEILREINPQNLSNASIVQNTINKGFELMTIFYGE